MGLGTLLGLLILALVLLIFAIIIDRILAWMQLGYTREIRLILGLIALIIVLAYAMRVFGLGSVW